MISGIINKSSYTKTTRYNCLDCSLIIITIADIGHKGFAEMEENQLCYTCNAKRKGAINV